MNHITSEGRFKEGIGAHTAGTLAYQPFTYIFFNTMVMEKMYLFLLDFFFNFSCSKS